MKAMDTHEVCALLEHVEVIVPCQSCGSTYAVPASVVRESQRMLEEGCSGSTLHECDASFYATLIDAAALDELACAWAAVCESATRHGGTEIMFATAGADGLDVDARALQRWDNEGGRPPAH